MCKYTATVNTVSELYIVCAQITQDGETFYSFVVKDDEAVLMPFYQPYDKKTEALNAEDSVSCERLRAPHSYLVTTLRTGHVCKTRDC